MIKNKPNHHRPVANFGTRPQTAWYRFFSSQRFLAIIGLIFLLVIIFPLARTYSQSQMVEKEITDVQKQINDYQNDNQQLKELATYLQSEQSLEEQARLNLNMKKPGEKVIVIEEVKPVEAKSADDSDADNVSNLVKWWRYFFH